MGDRANIVVRTNGSKFNEPGACVVFYTHWSGYSVPEKLAEALARGKGRWSDPPYLARIIFCQMIGASGVNNLTGFGISTDICDNEYPLLLVESEQQKVLMFSRSDFEGGRVLNCAEAAKPEKEWTFEEFAALKFENSQDRGPWQTINPREE